jgi:hypothetical protein
VRLLAFLEYAAIAVGAIGMAAARWFYLPKGFHLGLFLVGAGIALGGLESLITRRMSFRFSAHGAERYAGAPAVIWGFMAFVIGFCVIAAAYLMEEGMWRATLNHFARRPGPVIALGGLLVACAGILLMFNRGRRSVAWTVLVRAPKMLFGFLLVVIGAAAIGLGLWEVIEPPTYQRFVQEAGRQLYPEAVRRLWRSLLLPR